MCPVQGRERWTPGSPFNRSVGRSGAINCVWLGSRRKAKGWTEPWGRAALPTVVSPAASSVPGCTAGGARGVVSVCELNDGGSRDSEMPEGPPVKGQSRGWDWSDYCSLIMELYLCGSKQGLQRPRGHPEESKLHRNPMHTSFGTVRTPPKSCTIEMNEGFSCNLIHAVRTVSLHGFPHHRGSRVGG